MFISRRFYVISASLLSICLAASAQVSDSELRDDITLAEGVFSPYTPGDGKMTPAPSGYRPFYVSHYGRHGCRYHITPSIITPSLNALEAARDSGTLTPLGQELLDRIRTIYDLHDGMWSMLSDRGGEEHKQIARRMFERFRPVFTDRRRTQVHCVSSDQTRCLVSMAYSTSEVHALNPKLSFDFHAGKRYQKYVAESPKEDFGGRKPYEQARQYVMERADLSASALMAVAPADPYAFWMSVFRAWCICESIGCDSFDLTHYMTVDNIIAFFRADDAQMCMYFTWPGAQNLLNDFVSKADNAIVDGKTCADLRYGHDTHLVRLLTMLGVEGYRAWPTVEQTEENMSCTTHVCMGSNLQMAFYRNSGGDVLVKLLVNESERKIAGLEAVGGVYYRWADVKARILSVTGAQTAQIQN